MNLAPYAHPLLRKRDGHHARVTYEELFFDLVYVFAVTQLSHMLLDHLTPIGAFRTLILWFGVWLGWQYMCWITNWFDPETPHIRALVFATMLLALVMAAAIPDAFQARGIVFAGAYVAMQVGRTAFVVASLGRDHPLAANYRRILGWVSIAAVFWIAGGIAHGDARIALWLVAVLCEYVSPMFGFALPRLGRSRTRDWTIEGGHLTERCQLFVIVALGEAVLATGAMLSGATQWHAPVVSGFVSAFAGSLAMWWLYFGTSSKDATSTITGSNDPGRIGASFHYVHAILVAGIIVSAVGNDLVLAHPDRPASLSQGIVLVAGPVIYLIGSAIFKKVVYSVIPFSHVLASAVLIALALASHLGGNRVELQWMGWATTIVLLGASLWESRLERQCVAARAVAHH